MPSDTRVTMPTDEELLQEAAEWLANLNLKSDEEIMTDLFNRWCQVRDRTREAIWTTVQPFMDGKWMIQHSHDCMALHSWEPPCTCGLDKALKELRRAAKEARK